MIVDRICTLLRRRRVAAHNGIKFERSATFHLPDQIRLNDVNKSLKLPDEHGVKVAFIDLLLDDCYGCRSLKKLGAKVETVLDVGGNVGLFGVAARSAFPNAIIHSYEPNKRLEPYLAVQAKAADFEYFMEAVGLDKGMIALDLNEEESVLTRSREDETGNIPQIPFREAIERMGGSVDFLKMDCEGAEWEIFKDTESWLRVKAVSLEYHLWETNKHHDDVIHTLKGLGFKITSMTPIADYGLLTAIRYE